jgi:hypothetical protein
MTAVEFYTIKKCFRQLSNKISINSRERLGGTQNTALICTTANTKLYTHVNRFDSLKPINFNNRFSHFMRRNIFYTANKICIHRFYIRIFLQP